MVTSKNPAQAPEANARSGAPHNGVVVDSLALARAGGGGGGGAGGGPGRHLPPQLGRRPAAPAAGSTPFQAAVTGPVEIHEAKRGYPVGEAGRTGTFVLELVG